MKDENDKKPPHRDGNGIYEAPRVIRVALRPEEAVLGHCKVAGGAGVFGPGCKSVVPCRTPGS
jgi:hypothetical protein